MLYRAPSAIVTHFLTEVDLFQGLSIRHLERVAALCEDLDFKEGDYLGHQDQPGDRLYLVRSGEVTAITGAREKSLVVRTVRAHEAFPVAIFFNPPTQVTTARAATDGSAFVIPRVRLMELCQLEPRIGLHVFSAACGILARRYRYTLDRLAEVVSGVDISSTQETAERSRRTLHYPVIPAKGWESRRIPHSFAAHEMAKPLRLRVWDSHSSCRYA